LLDEIASAFRSDPPDGQLILADHFVAFIRNALPALRRVLSAATGTGHAVLSLASALEFIYIMLTARGTTDLIQAQGDFFGRHGFVRLDGSKDQDGPLWD
jgi:6-phosphogluconate dehydrogenase